MGLVLSGHSRGRSKTAGICRMACLAVAGLLAALTAASSAVAAPTTPSTAHQLQIGVPWSSSMAAVRPDYLGSEWLRLPEPMNPGDKITIASDADTWITYCLVPAVDDFSALAARQTCRNLDDEEDTGVANVAAGKWRRTLKWTKPSSHGFLLALTRSSATVYSVMVERIDRYAPDFTPPAITILDRRTKLARGRVGKVRMTCPASEASPPCSGSILATTRGKVRVGKTRRLLMLGRATFSLGANETGLIRLRLNQRRIKRLLRGRTSRVIHLTVRVRDNAGNSSAKRFNLRLVRR